MVALQSLALTLSLAAAGQTELLDFYSDQCPPCRQMAPVIAQFEAKGYPVKKINVTHQPQLAQQYRVSGVPCFVMVAEGREVGRMVGRQPASEILALYQRGGVTPQAYARQRSEVRVQGSGIRVQEDPSQDPTDPGVPRNDASPERLTVEQRAMAASVRIKINDGRGHSYGSGTIVDAQDGEALVLTCGHIFRDSQGKGEITVDLFDKDARPTGSVPGQVIRYDMQRDVGLIAIRPNRKIEPIRIAGRSKRMARGDRVFSIGCDRGDPPSVRDSRVAHINKYLGPANIEVDGAPIDGRSGGGLFTPDGKLIGVCNAADPEDDEGLYAALETIHAELIAGNLNFIIDDQRESAIAQTPARPLPPDDAIVPRGVTTPSSMHDDTEVIIILRSRSNPREQGEMLTIREPSRGLLDEIAQQRRQQEAPRDKLMQVAAPAPRSPVIRGQD